MNRTELNGRQVFVGRAQKRRERQVELKRRFEMIKQERMMRYQVPVTALKPPAFITLVKGPCTHTKDDL